VRKRAPHSGTQRSGAGKNPGPDNGTRVPHAKQAISTSRVGVIPLAWA